jgi:hemerythrin-like domain-containing protein
MPVVIGQKPQSGFDDPFGLLWDCHRRIENFLEALVKAAELGPAQMGDAEYASLDRALNHFRDAAVKHTADEEESVFPRLRETGHATAPLDALEADHADADALHNELDALGREWLSARTLVADKLERFRAIAEQLRVTYARHIATEDKEVFPLARRVLDRAALESIGREMADRRK